MQLLPIGSIIKIDDIDLMIVGYRYYQSSEFVFFYLVSVYPIGFNGDEKSLSLIPLNKHYEVISKGYTDSSVERYLEAKKDLYETLRNTKPNEIETVLNMMIEEKKQ